MPEAGGAQWGRWGHVGTRQQERRQPLQQQRVRVQPQAQELLVQQLGRELLVQVLLLAGALLLLLGLPAAQAMWLLLLLLSLA